MNWYPKDKSIEADLVPIKSCKTCTYQYGFNDLTCIHCCQLSNWKEVEETLNPIKSREEDSSTINSQGVGLLDGLTAPIYPSFCKCFECDLYYQADCPVVRAYKIPEKVSK
jgi:hypothetical protein